jgi:hypothetical protein
VESEALVRRIRQAENWLRRARADWVSGNASAALLRLMLAEAEIRHAREDGAAAAGVDGGGRAVPAAPVRPARTVRAAAAVAAAAALAAGIGYASFRAAVFARGPIVAHNVASAPVREEFGGRIVQLESGQFLMPDSGRDPTADRPLRFAVPVDLRTPSPTF